MLMRGVEHQDGWEVGEPLVFEVPDQPAVNELSPAQAEQIGALQLALDDYLRWLSSPPTRSPCSSPRCTTIRGRTPRCGPITATPLRREVVFGRQVINQNGTHLRRGRLEDRWPADGAGTPTGDGRADRTHRAPPRRVLHARISCSPTRATATSCAATSTETLLRRRSSVPGSTAGGSPGSRCTTRRPR
jgi:hypothetical protein